MLTITLSANDDHEAVTLHLEHSLVSLSKWESKHEKAFFGRDDKTPEETMDYVRCMILNENPPEDILPRLGNDHVEFLTEYINSKQSATWFREEPSRPNSETITSELIYYWLVQFRIPFQPAETWHLNRLMTLIKIAGIKQTKPKPMSRREQMEQYAQLNEQRRKQYNTTG